MHYITSVAVTLFPYASAYRPLSAADLGKTLCIGWKDQRRRENSPTLFTNTISLSWGLKFLFQGTYSIHQCSVYYWSQRSPFWLEKWEIVYLVSWSMLNGWSTVAGGHYRCKKADMIFIFSFCLSFSFLFVVVVGEKKRLVGVMETLVSITTRLRDAVVSRRTLANCVWIGNLSLCLYRMRTTMMSTILGESHEIGCG